MCSPALSFSRESERTSAKEKRDFLFWFFLLPQTAPAAAAAGNICSPFWLSARCSIGLALDGSVTHLDDVLLVFFVVFAMVHHSHCDDNNEVKDVGHDDVALGQCQRQAAKAEQGLNQADGWVLIFYLFIKWDYLVNLIY